MAGEHEGALSNWDYEPLTEDSGRVVIYELPSKVHGGCRARDHHFDSGDDSDDRRCTIAAAHFANCTKVHTKVQPLHVWSDGNLEPLATLNRNLFPTLVLGVVSKLRRYVEHPTIQVSIGVKVPYMRESCNKSVFLLQRDVNGNVMEQHVEFGQGLAFPDPLPSFPLEKLYHGSVLPPELVGHEHDPIAVAE